MSKQKSGATQAGSLWRADPMGMWRVNQDALLIVAREGDVRRGAAFRRQLSTFVSKIVEW
jgi:hypothetical protein